ncbi:MAG TPA: serine hydrolase [Edaphocola sp.]|nr:serine hydrolase [Edaphocola sp.]
MRIIKLSKIYLLLLVFSFQTIIAEAQAIDCFSTTIKDNRDLPENILGQTMGQKLESLLFWSQEEKERRFPIMQSIYPSIPVSTSNQTHNYKTGKTIEPKWDNNTTLRSYIKENRIGGLLVIKDNKIRLEAYGHGINSNNLWTSFSVAKSISSLLVGVALKEGAIESLDDSLGKYIPEFKAYDYGNVSVRQLLSMTSGIEWNEDYADTNSDVAQMYQKPCEGNEAHIISYMKTLKAAYKPGEKWNYSTGETDLVGILIQKATGKTLAEYLSEKIWKPMGMQHCAYWLSDECSGMNIGGSGLSASLRDYARLGTLMLNKGKINNESIVAEDWLKDATSILFQTNKNGGGYGYLWWCNPDGSYAAHGIFGQLLYINPAENLIITQVAAWPKAGSKELSQKQQGFIQAVRKALNEK